MGQQVDARGIAEGGQLFRNSRAFKPRGKEAGGLGALTRADYCKHIYQLSKLGGIFTVFSYTKVFCTICRKSTTGARFRGFRHGVLSEKQPIRTG